jgi:hypothetical protein
MRALALIPTGFGFFWIIAGVSALSQLTIVKLIALMAGALLVAAVGVFRGRRTARAFDKKRYLYALAGEAAGIVFVLLFCAIAEQPSLILPLIGAVVGLHFLPLAKVFEYPSLLLIGPLMTIVSFSALLWPPPFRDAVAGIGGGAILWLYVLYTGLIGKRQQTPGYT